jgi:NADPH-dependent ferric siderophore reductase
LPASTCCGASSACQAGPEAPEGHLAIVPRIGAPPARRSCNFGRHTRANGGAIRKSVAEYRDVVTTVRRTPLHRASVVATRPLTPGMRRLTLASRTFAAVAPRPAQDVEVILTDERGNRVKRRYTIRQVRAAETVEEQRERGADQVLWDLDIVLHGHGIGARWGARAEIGDNVDLFGPRGRLELSEANWHLFVGDESALPAIAALVEVLPTDQRAIALVEVADETEQLPMARSAGNLDLRWIHRDGERAGTAALLAHAIGDMATPAGTGHGYLLGESRAVVALRQHIAVHGLSPDRTYLKGYWNLGRL